MLPAWVSMTYSKRLSERATEGLTSIETTALVENHSQEKIPPAHSTSSTQAAASRCQRSLCLGNWRGTISSTTVSGVMGAEEAC